MANLVTFHEGYPGYGLNEARKKVFEAAARGHSQSNGDAVILSCLPDGYATEHVVGPNGQKRMFRGDAKAQGFDACRRWTRAILEKEKTCPVRDACSFAGTFQPPIHKHAQVLYAFSYFYDRIVPLLPSKESVTLRQLEAQAREVCSLGYDQQHAYEALIRENPLYCLDLAFIDSLWRDGYGIAEHSEIHLAKKIQGYETGWSLGESLRLVERNDLSCIT